MNLVLSHNNAFSTDHRGTKNTLAGQNGTVSKEQHELKNIDTRNIDAGVLIATGKK